jgi:hypothetical protein
MPMWTLPSVFVSAVSEGVSVLLLPVLGVGLLLPQETRARAMVRASSVLSNLFIHASNSFFCKHFTRDLQIVAIYDT